MPKSDISSLSRKNEVCMTEGSIFRHLLNFAIPLLLGNLFQQMYNMVDTWVVGNFVSNEAYSAVGSVAPVINTLIGFFSGFSSGAGVLTAHNPLLIVMGYPAGWIVCSVVILVYSRKTFLFAIGHRLWYHVMVTARKKGSSCS